MITGIDHLALVTTDVARAARFFTELLGFTEAGRLETPTSGLIIFVSLGGTQVELFGSGDPQAPVGTDTSVGFQHLALAVDDVDAECARLQAAGVEFSLLPTTVTPGLRIAFFRDPDGNRLELMQRL